MPWSQIFEFEPLALASVLLRTVVVYFALLLGIRLAGKRELGQMTPFDLIVILVISNAVQNAMVGPDTSLTAGLLAAFALLLINWGINRTALKWAWLGRHVVGTPTLLINNGQFVDEHLRREGITRDEVLMALREHGISDPAQAQSAVLEVDGSVSVVPMGAEVKRTRHRLRGRKPTQ
ncbi:MAG: DUF421 domain-containing protein [Chloroflexi bacterium]|nr:DUF421 domain-containing protein [Chloroflexota bacterium]